MNITLYTKPQCVQCNATKRALTKAGLVENVDYRTVDVSQDAEALEHLKNLGYLQAPVVVAGDDHWSGFRPDKIDGLKEARAAERVAEWKDAYEAEMRRLANGGHDVLTDGAP